MKHMKTVLILEHTEEVFEKLTCDVCGAESAWDENWSSKDNQKALTTVLLEEEDSLPQGGQSTQTQFHICPSCFKNQLTKWFEEQKKNNATITTSVW